MTTYKPIPTNTSTADVWINWHKALKKKFGRKDANSAFLEAWDRRAGAGSSASTVALRDYLADNGLKLTTTSWEDVENFGAGTADFLSSAFSFGKYVYAGLIVITVGAVAMILYNVGKDPNKAISAAMAAKTGGM